MDLELARARAKAKLRLRNKQKPSQEVPQEEEKPSILETVGRIGGQGLTAGFQDEASTVLGSGASKLDDLLGGRLAGLATGGLKGLISGTPEGQQDALRESSSYDNSIEDFRELNRKAREANPKTAIASELVGAGLSMAAGGGALGKLAQGTSKAANLAKGTKGLSALKQATAAGALGGTGYSEAQDAAGVAKDAAVGGAVGLGAGLAGKAVTPAVKAIAGSKPVELIGKGLRKGLDKTSNTILKASNALSNLSDDLALQNIELKSSTINRIGLDKAKKIGHALVEDGVATKPYTAKSYLKIVGNLRKKAGKELEALYRNADSKGEKLMNPKEVLNKVQQFLSSSDEFPDPRQLRAANTELSNMLSSKADDVGMSHTDVWNLVKNMESKINKWERASDPIFASKADTLDKVSGFLRKELADSIEALPGAGDLLSEIKGTSSVYNVYKTAQKGLQQKVQDAFGRRLPMNVNKAGILDKLTGASPIKGGLTGVTKIGSDSLKGISNIIKSNPGSMGKYSRTLENASRRGANAVSATHYTLMQKDPKYRETYEKAQKGSGE